MKKKVIAFDIGGTNMRCAVVKGKKILQYEELPTPKTKNQFLKAMEKLIKERDTPHIAGIGIGIAGSVKKGKLINAPNLPIKKFDFKKHFEKKFKKPVEIANDAGCFALAELYYGSKEENFILITLGTGIGGGMIINGNIYHGSGYGVEFGHILVRGKDWESLWKQTKKDIARAYGKDALVSDLAKKKSKKGKEILTSAADYMGEGVVTLIDAIGPQKVVFGGGVKESGNYFLTMIKKSVKRHSYFPKTPNISWTKLKHSGILGASLLI